MRCQACGFDNRTDARFCLHCGRGLVRSCAHCGRHLPAAARFCDGCGQAVDSAATPGEGVAGPAEAPAFVPRAHMPNHLVAKILSERSALEGERKQVTVLFADVVGSTALAEQLDPEEMHGIMDRCFRLLMEEVHRYEGTVNQFTGDGIMALFGAPIAHEDAPERAVRAGLGMQAALEDIAEELRRERGLDFRLRIGIHTGPVVVGKIGDDLHMDYTAIGNTANLAARLQTAAQPGAVLISEATAKLVGRRFVTHRVGPLRLKGKSKPVTAFEVERAQARAPLVALSERGLTPLVGRRAELAAIEALFRQACAGRGQIVFVTGEAGIGKSRLIHEFGQRLPRDAATWLDGRCISFGRSIPMLPIIDLLKAGLAIEETDSEADIVEKVRRGLGMLGADLVPLDAYVFGLLGLERHAGAAAALDASGRRFATFEALKRILLATAARRPLVMLVEDLHWVDPASEEFLTFVADAIGGAPILLLCTGRSEYRPVIADRSYFSRIALQPLSTDETAAMAGAMLDGEQLPREIRTLIAAKAEGNPFFIEEVTKSLQEVGALHRGPTGYELARPMADISIPNTIQDVIMARIDRLGDEPKRAIQVASVIGREFTVRLLQRASDLGERVNALVGELRAIELIYEKYDVPELAYMFKHALTHDVAYESLLMQRRKYLHQLIARAIEDLYADRLAEHWETLAYHFSRAGDWPMAFDYLVKAGNKARAAFANKEAVEFYDRALEAANHLQITPGQRAAILEGKARAHQYLSEFPEAMSAYRAVLALVRAPADRARIEVALAAVLWYAHEFDDAIALAEEARALVNGPEHSAIQADAHRVIGFVRLVRGELEEGERSCAEAVRVATAGGHRLIALHAAEYQHLLANWRGDFHSAVAGLEERLRELRAANELGNLVEAASHFGISLAGAGQYVRALDFLDESIAVAESIGDRFWRARMWNTRGWILNELGAYDAADDANRRSLELADTLGSLRITPELIGNAAANLADAALARRNLSAAESELARVAAVLGDPRNEWMTWRYRMHYQLTAAEACLARRESGRGGELARTCLATARRKRARRYVVRATRILAACHLAGDDAAAAEEHLAAAVREARGLGNPPQLWQALAAHGRVLRRLGRSEEAAAAWQEAVAVLDDTAAQLPPDLQRSLMHSPDSAEVREKIGLRTEV